MQLIDRFVGYAARILLFVCAFYGIYQLSAEWLNKDLAFIVAIVVFFFAEYKDHKKELMK